MSETITVVFNIKSGDRSEFLRALQGWDEQANLSLSFRTGDTVERRVALAKFVDRMETVLRAHDHKTTWRDRPLEALNRLMFLEVEEYKVAYDLLEVSEARKECVDMANYAMIVDDRLSLLDQDRSVREQLP